MTLKGIDVSQWQATTPSLTGLSFLFARASIGLDPDTKYKAHVANARAVGLVVGAYHFNWREISVSAQVRTFLAAAGDADLLVVDVEGNHAFTLGQTRDFITGVKAADTKHRKVGLYMSESGFYLTAGQDFNWIANWSHEPVKDWSFWQYRGSPLDLDYFAGTAADLTKLAGVPTAPDTGTPEADMTNYRAVGEDWTTGGAPVRLTPDRTAPAAVTIPSGSTVRTVAEFQQSGEAWRVTRLPDGRTGFLIRGDLTPVTPGGDPAVDAPFLAYVQRKAVTPDAVACKPFSDAAVKTAVAADRTKAYVAWKA